MLTPVNTFKAALRRGTTQFGLWLGFTDTVCVEIAAGAGFDWLLLDSEHAPNDLRTLLAGLQTVAAYPVQPIVRIATADATIMKRVLDIGAQSVIVPMIETADQARLMVEAMRYPPHGIRGVGTALARASRWNRVTDYFERANAEMCLIVQIESRTGLETSVCPRIPQCAMPSARLSSGFARQAKGAARYPPARRSLAITSVRDANSLRWVWIRCCLPTRPEI